LVGLDWVDYAKGRENYIKLTKIGSGKGKGKDIAVRDLTHHTTTGNHTPLWDHSVLPATRQR